MTVPYTCISLLSARRVSSSYTDQVGCIQSVNTQKNFSWPKSCTDPVLINNELHVKL